MIPECCKDCPKMIGTEIEFMIINDNISLNICHAVHIWKSFILCIYNNKNNKRVTKEHRYPI